MTARYFVTALLLVLMAGQLPPAAAQYNQFPQVPPPLSPPAIAPGPAAPQSMPSASQSRSPSLVPRSGGPPVEVPRGSWNDSFGDRATRCMHSGAAAGVPPGEIGAFTRDCVNN